MKKHSKQLLAFALFGTLIGTNIFAYSDEDRIKDMQQMEKAVQQMQKGFLYNNIKDIEDGATLLKKHTSKIEPPVKNADEFSKNYAYQTTKREAKKIISLANESVKEFKEHRPKQAMNSFTKVLKQCMTCHARIRKW